jgi:hypothetical protein
LIPEANPHWRDILKGVWPRSYRMQIALDGTSR